MKTESLRELFLRRQSCRNFSAAPIARELIEEICSLAGLAPSACNMQPWKVYALTGEKLVEAKTLLVTRKKMPFINGAPVILAIAEDTRASAKFRPEINLPYYASGDVGEFTAYLVLAAEAAGLSSCIIGWQNAEGVKELLSLPDGVSVPWFLVLGYAAEGDPVRTKSRKQTDEILTFID